MNANDGIGLCLVIYNYKCISLSKGASLSL